MNKTQIIEKLSSKTNLSKVDASNFLDAFVEVITKSVKNDKRVAISGLGIFKKAQRAQRAGVNPKTGEKITIKSKGVLKFTAAKSFKELLA